MKRSLLFSLVLTLLAFDASFAQDSSILFDQIKRDLKKKEPAWRVETIHDMSTGEPVSKALVLRAGKGQASIFVRIWTQVKDAQEDFALSTADITRARSKDVKKRLANLGDESFIWTIRGSTAWPTIDFRQGTVYASVFAPSVSMAKRFARHILGSISATQ